MWTNKRLWIVPVMATVLWMSGGCTSTYELRGSHLDPIRNSAGPAVVVKVTDRRKFQADTSDLSVATVKDSKDVANPTVTSHVMGRRDHNGGHWFLVQPEDRTVASVIQTTVENALRTKGYSVVAADSSGAANAIPVDVSIARCWEWEDEGFWTMEVNFDVTVNIGGPVVVDGGASVSGRGDINTGWLVWSLFDDSVQDGLNDLIKNVQPKLKSPT